MSSRLSMESRAKKLTWPRRAAGLAAIVFLLLAGGQRSPGDGRWCVAALVISTGLWAILKGRQFVILRYFYEYEVGRGYEGRYAVAVGWVTMAFGGLLMVLGTLGLLFR